MRRGLYWRIVAAAAFLGIVVVAWLWLKSYPQFLVSEGGTRWIRLDEPPRVTLQPPGDYVTVFRKTFTVEQSPQNATLTVRGFLVAAVVLDGVPLGETSRDPRAWKQPLSMDLAGKLAPGRHELRFVAWNRMGPSCVLAYCDAIGLHTGPDWEASTDGIGWTPARRADAPQSLALTREFPRADRALLSLLPFYVPLFLVVVALTLYACRISVLRRWAVTPATVRWLLFGAWGALALNNLLKVDINQGFDVDAHIQYILYVAEHWRVPLASEGWQMFQSPLYYLVSAPLFRFLSLFLEPQTACRWIRVIPLLSGMLQVEICYRVLRHVFPVRKDLQIMGTFLGGLLPMNVYIAQYLSNESPAGLLAGLVILLAVRMLHRSPNAPWVRPMLLLGLCLGLAALTKVTAVLLVLPLALLIGYLSLVREPNLRRAAMRALAGLTLVIGVAFLICGWYYLRNCHELGKPFVGGWEAGRGFAWWQDPGYRTPRDFTAFGQALEYPIYASLSGFWNGLYSTLWLDGLVGGSVFRADCPPWNYGFLLSGVWLALLPTLAIILGCIAALRRPSEAARSGLLLAMACVGIYFAALVCHFLTNPSFCAAKAFYAVGTTACLAVLAAAGLDLLTRLRPLRPVVYGLFACWIAAAYLGYFVW